MLDHFAKDARSLPCCIWTFLFVPARIAEFEKSRSTVACDNDAIIAWLWNVLISQRKLSQSENIPLYIYSRSTVALQSLYSRYIQSLYSRSKVALQSLYSRYTIAIQSLYSHSKVALQSLYTVAIQSLYSRSTVARLWNNHRLFILEVLTLCSWGYKNTPYSPKV